MPDYRHSLQFGVFLSPATADLAQTTGQARRAESLGLELAGVQDHPYHPGFADTLTLLTHLALSTSTVTVFPDVASLPLRGPVALAGWVATLAELTGDRVALGIGSGVHQGGIASLGGPSWSPGQQVRALEEAVRVLRALLGGRPGQSVDGAFYRLADAPPIIDRAVPAPLWLGGYRPRTLNLIGRVADGWIPSSAYMPPGELSAASRLVDEAALSAGRDPVGIRRLYNIDGVFTSGAARGFLNGPAKVWVEQLTELAVTEGVSGFILAPGQPADVDVFAQEVAPAVREAVRRVRAT